MERTTAKRRPAPFGASSQSSGDGDLVHVGEVIGGPATSRASNATKVGQRDQPATLGRSASA